VLAIVCGMIGTFPVGGVVWDYGQYVLGLQRLGFDVFYLEDTGAYGYDHEKGDYVPDGAAAASYLDAELAALGDPPPRWHLRAYDGTRYGTDEDELAEALASAAVLVNVSGSAILRDEYLQVPVKVLIDTDPGWNHFVRFPAHDAGGLPGHGFRAHDSFFTYAERMGRADCPLPTFDLPWRPTRPPVVLDCWQQEPPGEAWTTVLSWDNYRQPLEHGGRTYGSKEQEMRHIEALPGATGLRLEIAAGGVRPPVRRWRELGWSVVDSMAISTTARLYRSYVQSSRGELSIAKNVYVDTRSGWFSCRSVCYLAAGRPAVVQDTGFSQCVKTGEGLIAFANAVDAEAGLRLVEADYQHHALAARTVAETEFASDRVLGDLLHEAGVG
jgi:hypothetical protein